MNHQPVIAGLRASALPACLIGAWEIASVVHPSTSESLAAPHQVVVAMLSALGDGTLLFATAQTILSSAGGLLLGVAIGLCLGLLFGLAPVIDRITEVSIEAIRPIPSIALIPVAMLVFGFGYRLEISVVAFTCIWPVMILSRTAVRGVDPRLIEVSRVLRLSTLQTIVKIVLPAIVPRLFVAVRLTASIALIVAITAEIAVNPLGLGASIMAAQVALNPALMLAILVWIGCLGAVVNIGLLRLEHILFGRRQEQAP